MKVYGTNNYSEDDRTHLDRMDELAEMLNGYRADMIKAVQHYDVAAYIKAKQSMAAARDEIELTEKYMHYLATGQIIMP